jgi:ABC-type uncharacterized transport system substrate-binding protein
LNRREVLFAIGAFVAAPALSATPRRYLLLYPEVTDSERSVFRLMREGVAHAIGGAGGSLVEHGVRQVDSAETVSAAIAANRPDVLITLGRVATMLAQAVTPAVPWLTGATEMPVPTPNVGGISLIIDPERFFATLAEVAPRINRVSVVIEPARFGWLRATMQRAAHGHSKQLAFYEADTVAEAATHYLNVLRYGNPMTDSLWLLEQGHFVNADTLPRIIEEAWANQFLVFSSVLKHVSEGSLFALYMDPASLGSRLGRLAVTTSSRVPPMAFDDAPARAINLRTARHLSNLIDVGSIKSFDLTLGEL